MLNLKPTSLIMQAFGPYLDKTMIDFSKLENKLFLISGRTGSGKTAILDAISFALYCKSTGGRRSFKDMRNILATNDKPTFVRFEFFIGENKYRFYRCLKWCKVRGSDRLELRDEHECLRWNFKSEEWQLIVSGSEMRVREQAQRLLGLTCEQFSQVIVLPQGEFRKLMLSNSREKAKIFQALFRTERFEEITKSMQKLAYDIENKSENNLSKKDLLLKQVNVDNESDLEELINIQSVKLEKAVEESNRFKEEFKTISLRYSKESRDYELFSQLKEVNENIENFLKSIDNIKAQRLKLENSRKANKIYPYYVKYIQAKEDTIKKLNEFNNLIDESNLILKKVEKAENEAKDIPKLKYNISKLNKTVTLLQGSIEAAKKLDEVSKKINILENGHSFLKNKVVAEEENNKKISNDLNNISSDVDNILLKIKDLPSLKIKAQEYEIIFKNFDELELKNDEYNKSKESYQDISKKYEEAEKKLELLEKESDVRGVEENYSIDEDIEEFRGYLEENKPCPLCGAIYHQGDDLRDTSDFLKVSGKRKNQIGYDIEIERNKFKDICRKLAEEKYTYEKAGQELNDQLLLCNSYEITKEEAKNNLDETNLMIDNLEKEQRDLDKNQRLIIKLKRELSESDFRLKDCETQLQEINIELERAKAAEDSIREMLPQEVKNNKSMDLNSLLLESIDTAQRIINRDELRCKELEENLLSSKENLSVLNVMKDSYKRDYDEALRNEKKVLNEFKNITDKMGLETDLNYELLKVDDDVLSNMEKEIYEYDLNLRKKEEIEKSLSGVKVPDLEKSKLEMENITIESNKAFEKMGKIKQFYEVLIKVNKNIESLNQESEKLKKEYGKIVKISKLLSGENKEKVPFKMFVLGIMLDDILSYANIYFSKFSLGRYSLNRVANKESGKGFGGLDLSIFDAHYGKTRSVDTLSGGELFLASLSLAFGLSDMIQSYSGGIYLNSVFIDEGFGALDDETLNIAMNALNDIQRSGRTVGIISHVSEIQNRILNKIKVTKLVDGSSQAVVDII